jgi:hypothetical protein
LKKIIVYGSNVFVDTVKSKNKDAQIIPFFEPNSFYNAVYAFENQDVNIIIDENSVVEKKGPFSFLGFNKNKLTKSEIETHPILSRIGKDNTPSPKVEEPIVEEPELQEPVAEEPAAEEPAAAADEDFDLEALIAGGFNDEPEPEDDGDFDLEALIAGGVDNLPKEEEPASDNMDDEDFDLEALIANAEMGQLPGNPLDEEGSLEDDLQKEIEESIIQEDLPPLEDASIDDLEKMMLEEQFVEEKSSEIAENIVKPDPQMPAANSEELKEMIKSSIKESLAENETKNIYADLSTLNSILSHMLDNKDIHIKVSLREDNGPMVHNTGMAMQQPIQPAQQPVMQTPMGNTPPPEINIINPLAEQGKGLNGAQPVINIVDPLAEQGKGLNSMQQPAPQQQEFVPMEQEINIMSPEDNGPNYDLDFLENLNKQNAQKDLLDNIMNQKKKPGQGSARKKAQPDLVGEDSKRRRRKKTAQPDLPTPEENKRRKPKEKPKSNEPVVDMQAADISNMSDDELFALLNG